MSANSPRGQPEAVRGKRQACSARHLLNLQRRTFLIVESAALAQEHLNTIQKILNIKFCSKVWVKPMIYLLFDFSLCYRKLIPALCGNTGLLRTQNASRYYCLTVCRGIFFGTLPVDNVYIGRKYNDYNNLYIVLITLKREVPINI